MAAEHGRGVRWPSGRWGLGRVIWPLGLGAALLLSAWHPPDGAAQDLVNPFPGDAASTARGREIYSAQCAICHGVSGRGDGPLSRTMVPRPADFRVHLAEGHTETQLYEWVTSGVPDTGMQGFADTLAPGERWDVINYILTFVPSDQ